MNSNKKLKYFLYCAVTASILALSYLLLKEDSPNISLICNKNHFILKPQEKKVDRINFDSIITGKLTTTKTTYELDFPGTKEYYPLLLRINRYDGTYIWEHGNENFKNNSLKNILKIGVCKKTTIKRIF